MKKIKNYLIGMIIFLLLPVLVNAGEIRFNHPVKTSNNTYEFTLTVDNIILNTISGSIGVTNGKITKITMSNSWLNKTGNNNTFYFYRNGSMTGSYTVATIEVTMTDNSEYTVHNLSYKLNKCVKDSYGNYFGENGSIVSKSTYDETCSISKDATLKSITPSSGSISPKFNPSLELYSITVNNKVSSIKWNPIVNNSKAKVISGSTCSLKVGINLCKIVVEAEAGNQKTYTITVTRKNVYNNTLSTDASISNLVVHGGTLTKTFNPNTHEYDVKMNKNASSLYFTFITNSNKQNHTSKACTITDGTKTCKLTITAEDGVTKNSYLFNIIQENNSNAGSTSNSVNSSSSTTNVNSSTNKNNAASANKNSQSSASKEENNNSSNIEVNVENEETNKNSDSLQNVETKEDQIESIEEKQEEKKDTIKIPLMDKEVSKDIVGKVVAVVDLILGIGIGVFIAKRQNRKSKEK